MTSLAEFYRVLDQILSMNLGLFLRAFRDLLPDYDIVHEDATIDEVFQHIAQGKDYVIVIDHRGKLRGAVTYLDLLMYIGRQEHRVLTTALASIGGTLRISRIPIETLEKMRVSILMRGLPPHLTVDHSVREALDMMERTDIPFLVVQTPDGGIAGIVTMHAIFRAAIEKLKAMTK